MRQFKNCVDFGSCLCDLTRRTRAPSSHVTSHPTNMFNTTHVPHQDACANATHAAVRAKKKPNIHSVIREKPEVTTNVHLSIDSLSHATDKAHHPSLHPASLCLNQDIHHWRLCGLFRNIKSAAGATHNNHTSKNGKQHANSYHVSQTPTTIRIECRLQGSRFPCLPSLPLAGRQGHKIDPTYSQIHVVCRQ